MSVSNILITDDRVYCLTDQLVYTTRDGKGVPDSLGGPKADVMPGGFATATRGNVWCGNLFADALLPVAGLDEAEPVAAYLLDRLAAIKATERPELSLQAFAFGWSRRHGGPRCVVYELPQHGIGWTVRTLPAGLHLFPGYPGAVVPVPKPGTPPEKIAAGLVKVALAQFETRAERCPEMCIGGAMHLTVAGLDGADQRLVGLYPNRDALAEVFGDPLADEVAEFRRTAGRAAA